MMFGVRPEMMMCGLPGVRHVYEFGGGGSSSSTQTSTQNIDKRQVVDGASVGVSSDSSTVHVTSTDHASVNAAIDLAKVSTAAQGASLNAILGFAEKALTLTEGNINLQTKSAEQIGAAYSTAGNRTLATLGIIAAGIVAIFAFKRKGA
ncbi:MAG: hypothetical protein ACT4PS_08730 [Betaproteobacteria bacterium]